MSKKLVWIYSDIHSCNFVISCTRPPSPSKMSQSCPSSHSVKVECLENFRTGGKKTVCTQNTSCITCRIRLRDQRLMGSSHARLYNVLIDRTLTEHPWWAFQVLPTVSPLLTFIECILNPKVKAIVPKILTCTVWLNTAQWSFMSTVHTHSCKSRY